jgi:proline iminopeptidase
MDRSAGQNRAVSHLYPPLDPFDQRMLDVGDGHRIYVEQCGNPNGIPVVVLHGGPGGGCSPAMRRYFDPSVYRVILFDQRGCGRSRPHASVTDNTTWHLIRDIELIRTKFDINRWIVFGGSWGATLALLYAQSHPDRAAYLVLRGVFLMTDSELNWFYGGGAGQFFPELWAKFTDLIPKDEHSDLITAYHERLFSQDMPTQTKYARMWSQWENALAAMNVSGFVGESHADYARAFARLENHYFINKGFLETDGQIMKNRDMIEHIPASIVQGRYDMICPPHNAFKLAQGWDKAELHMIRAAGHALSEPGITAELIRITDSLCDAEHTLDL